MSPLIIALDTSCLNAKKTNVYLNELDALEALCVVTLTTSTVNEKEQSTISSDYWRAKYLTRINEKKKRLEVGRFDRSSFGGCVFGGEGAQEKLAGILGTNPESENDFYDFYDLWLLETALAGDCHYFLTLNSKDFVDGGKKEKLEALGIKIRQPDACFLGEINARRA